MLLHRYHNIDYVLDSELELGLALIDKALEQEQEERLHRQWTAQLPVMAFTGEVVSFAEYKDRATGANIDRRPVAVIEQELDEVEEILRRGGAVHST